MLFCIPYFLYFLFVASPPRMWRSALFWSSTSFTFAYRLGFIFLSLSATSLCTVDLLIQNFLAVALTVALFSTIYSASINARSSTTPITFSTPYTCSLQIYEHKGVCMQKTDPKNRVCPKLDEFSSHQHAHHRCHHKSSCPSA